MRLWDRRVAEAQRNTSSEHRDDQKSNLFYATAQNLSGVLSSLEAQKDLQYTLAGLFDSKEPQTYFSYADIPIFGQSSHPSAIANPTYLVSPRGTTLRTHAVPQKAGGVCFAISQRLNDDTIIFSHGGWYGSDVILHGRTGTISNSVTSKNLYNFFAKPFRERFEKVQEFYVGTEALNRGKVGVRLTIGASPPVEFDLRI
jgi:hypothetical protein